MEEDKYTNLLFTPVLTTGFFTLLSRTIFYFIKFIPDNYFIIQNYNIYLHQMKKK